MESLRLEAFSFSYPGAAPVLCGVEMQVDEGAFAVLFGPTGSGKSTLLRCVKREIAPVGDQSGRIFVLGQDVSDAAFVPEAGLVFQAPESQIVCDSVWQELAFGLENQGLDVQEMRRRIAEVATLFGLGGVFEARTSELSGGQKQMLNLASVIAMRPQLLLLDEPVSQLDPISARRFLDAVMHLNRDLGITVVASTHDPESMAPYATSFLEVARGRVSEVELSGLPSEEAQLATMERAQIAEIQCAQAGSVVTGRGANASSKDAVVSAKDVWHSYVGGGEWTAKGLDLDVLRGEVLALVGANGCGKTTLLKLAAGILEPKRGRIRNELSSSQAYVPQDVRLLFVCNTVEEELRELQGRAGYTDEDVTHAARCFGLEGLLRRNPLDISGGQQQCLALAKVSLLKPQLLLLDEPAKGLDATFQLSVALQLRRMAQEGATVVLSSHDLSFASRAADRIALLFDGQVAALQPPLDFSRGNFFYRPRTNLFTRMFDEACPEIGRKWASFGDGGAR